MQWVRCRHDDDTKVGAVTRDVIACGTSVGVGSMKHGAVVTVSIDGIGSITNTFEE